jgi:hypothetical protein
MKASKLSGALLLISLGGVLLLNNLGYVPWQVWGKILWLWPLILIAWGIEKLFKHSSLSVLAYLSPLLILLWFWLPVFLQQGDWGGWSLISKDYEFKENFENKIKQGELTIYHYDGKLFLSADSTNLFYADLDYWNKKPIYDYSFSDLDSIATVKIRDWRKRVRGWHFGVWFGGEWSLNLSNRIPWDIQIDSRNCSGDLDLSAIETKNLKIDFVRDKFSIKFGKRSDSLFSDIYVDHGELKIIFPKEVGLQIEKRGEWEEVNISNTDLNPQENIYTTANYNEAAKKINLILDGDVKRLEVETY